MRFPKWFLVILVASLFLLAACDDNDDGETTNGDTPEPQATEELDSPDESEDESETAPGFDHFSAFSGDWSGGWNNDTFGSTGPITLTIAVNDDGTIDVTIDIDGSVFGVTDPPAKTFSGTYDENGASIEVVGDDLFGDVTVSAGPDGTISVTATAIPVPGIAGFSAEGTATPDGIDVTYTVTFDDGTTAEGTGTLTKS